MRRLGEGIEDYGKYILHYKGETPGQYGVGFLVKREYSDRIEELRGISERIAILNIKLPIQTSKEEYWSIIQAYSPTESDKKEDVDKIELFYQNLQRTVDTAHKNVILMGDFNGQIGECRAGEEYAIGRYGNGKRSKNGERLVNFGGLAYGTPSKLAYGLPLVDTFHDPCSTPCVTLTTGLDACDHALATTSDAVSVVCYPTFDSCNDDENAGSCVSVSVSSGSRASGCCSSR
ncbi:hypothetical protein MSG28_010450 [Choristoneura fumiferana]|uniref:Uncharacterized protein n=1 Tax=Choristoneura fumiferana TaxID=7141 RepID=A0ACC0KL54_CHOFU|nr:hypothetical protein MSG28_010450 [Choristoneura fumiferana]